MPKRNRKAAIFIGAEVGNRNLRIRLADYHHLATRADSVASRTALKVGEPRVR